MTHTSYIPIFVKKKIDFNELDGFFIKNTHHDNRNICILYPVQYKDIYSEIKNNFNDRYNFIEIKLTNCFFDNQVLGCNNYLNAINDDAFSKLSLSSFILILGDGVFHQDAIVELILRKELDIPVFSYNLDSFKQIDKEKIKQKISLKTKKLTLFFSKEKIGIIKTIKHGQHNNLIIEKVAQICEKFNKDYYYFLSNTIDLNKLPDFNKVELWINTACSRIYDDDLKKNIIDARDLIEYVEKHNL